MNVPTVPAVVAGTALALSLAGTAAVAPAQADTSPARAVAKAGTFTVTATVNNSEPLAGSKVKIKGSVKPAAPGAQVLLQLRYADQKKWKTIDRVTLSQASKFKFKDKVKTVRIRKYRVVKPAGPNRGAGHSKPLKVTVFGWRTLDSLKPAQAASFQEAGAVKINGVSYPSSLLSFSSTPQTSHIDYNLNRDCKAFQGTFGISDSSPSAGTAAMSLVADGVTKFTGSFGLAQSQAVSTDVTRVFRITVNATNANGGQGAVGTPRVLCSF
jgi:NPCBM/NEW2 domain-containing protein